MPSRNAWQVTNDAWRTMHGETGRSRRAVRRKRRRETRGSARRRRLLKPEIHPRRKDVRRAGRRSWKGGGPAHHRHDLGIDVRVAAGARQGHALDAPRGIDREGDGRISLRATRACPWRIAFEACKMTDHAAAIRGSGGSVRRSGLAGLRLCLPLSLLTLRGLTLCLLTLRVFRRPRGPFPARPFRLLALFPLEAFRAFTLREVHRWRHGLRGLRLSNRRLRRRRRWRWRLQLALGSGSRIHRRRRLRLDRRRRCLGGGRIRFSLGSRRGRLRGRGLYLARLRLWSRGLCLLRACRRLRGRGGLRQAIDDLDRDLVFILKRAPAVPRSVKEQTRDHERVGRERGRGGEEAAIASAGGEGASAHRRGRKARGRRLAGRWEHSLRARCPAGFGGQRNLVVPGRGRVCLLRHAISSVQFGLVHIRNNTQAWLSQDRSALRIALSRSQAG